MDDDIGDDLLRLLFISCHPILSTDARVALTLRLLGGLTTTEIARAYLVSEVTVAQRIVRAKRTLSEANIPFEVPQGEDRVARLGSVLEVIYLIFNEGYAATAGDDWMRPSLCEDAMRLGRILVGLVPEEPEVHGLVALMEIQASRMRARIGPRGEPILLLDQDLGVGIIFLSAEVWPRSNEPRSLTTRADRTPCKLKSLPATGGRGPRKRLTGRASPRSTPHWLRLCRRRSWS